jgi:hypothetical protein
MTNPIRDIVLHYEMVRDSNAETGIKNRQLDQAEQAINAYILGEVMELIGDDEKSKARPDKLRQSPPWQRNQLRQELRNKANKKFGGMNVQV